MLFPLTVCCTSGPHQRIASEPAAGVGAPALPSVLVPVPAAPPAQAFGVHTSALALPLDSLRASLAQLAAAGLTLARFEVRWAQLEPWRKGEWAPDYLRHLDDVLDAMRSAHVRPIVVLTSTPAWARQNDGSPASPPSDPADFGDAAGFLARRYADRPDLVYEIWNEPNQAASWDSRHGPDAALYAGMLRAAYTQIKSAAPAATVLGGSIAFNDLAYLDWMYQAGAQGSFDGLAIHPYCQPGCPPDSTTDTYNSFTLAVTQMEQRLADNGEPDKPIWITAMGWSSSGVNNDESTRAGYLRRAVELVRGWPFVSAFVAYRLESFGSPSDFDLATSGPVDAAPEDLAGLLSSQLGQFADLTGRVLDVRDFGARGDGVSDDTAAVRGALAAANGATLLFPAGTYLLSSIAVPAGAQVRIVGEGQGVSVLVHLAGSTASMWRASDRTVGQFELAHLTLDGNQAHNTNRTMSLIDVRVDRLLVQDVELRNSIQQAIHLRTTTYTSIIRDSWLHDFALHSGKRNEDTRAVQVDHEIPSSGDVWFINNRVEMTTAPAGPGNSAGGIRSSGEQNTRLFVLGNVFKNMGQDIPSTSEYIAPIDIYRNGDGSVIQGNEIDNSYYDAIRVMRTNEYRVVGNTIDGEGELNVDSAAGIRGEGRTPKVPMHGVTIRGNTIRNLPHLAAIRLEYDAGAEARDIDLSGNDITNTQTGIYLSYVLGRVGVRRNTVRHLVGTGFGLAGVRVVNNSPTERTDLEVLDNIFQDLGAARPVVVDDGSRRQVYVAVQHNYIEDSAGDGVTVRYAAEVDLRDNVWRGRPSRVIDLQHDAVVRAFGNRSENAGATLVSNEDVIDDDNSWTAGRVSEADFGLVHPDGTPTGAWDAYATAVAGNAAASGRGRGEP
jgi:hypothetical protein